MSKPAKKVRFINPPNKLKEKVGGGGIAPDRLLKAQEYINNNEFDFLPYAQTFIESVKKYISKAKSAKSEPDRNNLITPIMHLKANGGMFKYDLISQVADICLNFVESVDVMNDDAYEVVNAHINTITIITHNKMTGPGGNEGSALIKELQKACQRFFKKHPQETPE